MKNDDGEFYAGRTGRLMWRIANRRFRSAQLLADQVYAKRCVATFAGAQNIWPADRQSMSTEVPVETNDPGSVREFFQLLATELAEDDSDLDK